MTRPPPGSRNAFHRREASTRWTVSYLDVLTIMLVLFVAMAAQSAAEPEKPKSVAPPSSPQLLKLKHTLEQMGFTPRIEQRGLVLSMPQAVVFAPGEDQMDASAHESVRRIAQALREIPNRVSLIGYADATPIHNNRFNDNWELAAARSLRLLDVLAGEYGIPESRLSVASYGANDPKSANDNEEARASNRRVEIVVLDQTGTAASPLP